MSNNINLTDAQRKAVDCIDGHLQIIACAGSGKTEVVSRRIANILQKKNEIKPENIVAFTFTDKAASSLKKRIDEAVGCEVQGMYVGTIHRFCKHILSTYSDRFSDFKILDTVKSHHFINRYADMCGMTYLGLKPSIYDNKLFLQCIDKLIDDYDNRDLWEEKHHKVLEQYMNCLYEHKYIDFSLLIFEALRQINENTQVCEYLKQIKYLVVDEYQDVNDLQEKLISAIADYGAGVCVVGDDDQTIYQFRGSNSENMLTFSERYPNVTRVNLEENFRSQIGIVDIASNVISNNNRRLPKKVVSGATISESVSEAHGYSSIDEEFSAIAEKIENFHRNGVEYKNFAVLVRKGKYVSKIASKLQEKEIPFVADSAEDFFTGKYFNRFVETLRILDNIDKAALYAQWEDIVGGAHLNVGFKYLRSCTRGGQYRLGNIVNNFCEKIDFLNNDAPDLKTRVEDLNGLVTILNDYDEIYGDYQLSYRISRVLRFLGTEARQEYKYHNFRETSDEDDAVQIMTVHKAKGLEFQTVFLPRLNDREFPIAKMGGKKYHNILGGIFEKNKSKYESDIEDERKLFYVAVTRAKNNLYLSYAFEKQKVSEFVSEAAKSSFLVIDKKDLLYDPTNSTKTTQTPTARSEDSEDEQIEKELYLELVARAKEELYDYYAIGNHFCPGIIEEYFDLCRRGPDAILEAAGYI